MEGRLCPCPAPAESSSTGFHENPLPMVKKEDELSATICPSDNPPATGCNSPINDDIHEQNDTSSAFGWSESKQDICSIKNTCGGIVTSSDFKMEDTHDIKNSLPTDSIYKKNLLDSELSHEIKFERMSDSESTFQLHQENLQVKTEYELPTASFNYPINDNLCKQESSAFESIESKQNLCSIENACGGQVPWRDFKMKNNDDIECILPSTSSYNKCFSDSQSSLEIYFEHTTNGESTLQQHQGNLQVKKEVELPITGRNSPVNFDLNEQESSALERSESKQNLGSIENTCGEKVSLSDFKMKNIATIESTLPTTSNFKNCFPNSELSHEIYLEHASNGESTLQLDQKNVIQFENEHCSKSWHVVHERAHTGEKPYKCDICFQSFSLNYSLFTHKKVHTERKLYECDICSKSFSQKYTLAYHKIAHTESTSYKCEICLKSFKRKFQLAMHERSHTGEKPYKCDICLNSFSQKPSIVRHMESHTKEKLHKCNICKKSFLRKYQLFNHELCHVQEKPYKCEICSKSFTHQCFLATHEKSHTGEKPFKCDVCSKSFTRIRSLTIHEMSHSTEKPFKCNICFKSFVQKYQLAKHEISHTGERPYECDLCSKSFAQKANFVRHVKSHTAKKLHKCDVCLKSYARKSDLASHMMFHHDLKPHKCNICSKSFVQKNDLIKHKRTHTGEKPYKCDICFKSFAIKSYVVIHKRSHSGEKPYKCDICLKSYSAQSNFQRHFKSHTEKCIKV
ncbi:uncharacterized protein LOC143915136 isoform X1 [Arctopsyche grandis]|uniref:uncharacterized protein LOC143915136 isoform X1 n=2 Tax=Arctopsyche grandis TaxID=121162 RepID=UPI00406D6709